MIDSTLKNNDVITTKQYLALASVMLLAPAVSLTIRANDVTLTPEETTFVDWFIWYGYYILCTLSIAVICQLLSMITTISAWASILSKSIGIIAIIMIFIGIVATLRNIHIIENKQLSLKQLKKVFSRQ